MSEETTGRDAEREHQADAHTVDSAADEALEAALHDVAEESAATRSESGDVDLHQAVEEANRRALVAQAELENFRKRTRREQSEQLKFSLMPILRDLLPVIDNFERAIGAVPQDDANSGMVEGIRMVQKMLMDVLSQHGCHPIPTEGPFDPMQHEAVGQMPSDEVPAGSVLKVMQTGYKLHDRVIRPSQVIVSQGS